MRGWGGVGVACLLVQGGMAVHAWLVQRSTMSGLCLVLCLSDVHKYRIDSTR